MFESKENSNSYCSSEGRIRSNPKKSSYSAKKVRLGFRGFRTFFAVGHPLCDVVLFLVDLFLPSDVQQKRGVVAHWRCLNCVGSLKVLKNVTLWAPNLSFVALFDFLPCFDWSLVLFSYFRSKLNRNDDDSIQKRLSQHW